MTKKDQHDAGPKFAPVCAEKTKNSERAMTSRELKNLYYLKKGNQLTTAAYCRARSGCD